MKKIFLATLGILLIAIACTYIFIPTTLKVSTEVPANANQFAVFRMISSEQNWKNWFPSSSGEFQFAFGTPSYNSQEVMIKTDPSKPMIGSQMQVVSIDADSVSIGWECSWNIGYNPWVRYTEYKKATKLLNTMNQVLDSLKLFVEKKSNIYGYEIREAKVKDTVLMATKFETIGYPDVATIYKNINTIRSYIAKNGAKETNYPMLHFSDMGNNTIETMIGIPTNKILPDTKTIFLKRLILGNILEGEVKGGPFTTKQALKQAEVYIRDYKKTPPAIPFEMLVTDRSAESDTSKWITRIYYPIF